MAEKVRYHLEQTLPELEDLHKKGLFSRDEIASISRRRTDFEHRINNRGSTLLNYLKYAEYEINLDLLRKKRIARNSGPQRDSVASWAGHQRILFIFDRATKKFTSDLELWKQYIAYARQHKSRKVLVKIFRQLVRYLPAQPIVWIWAAEHELRDNSNRKAARNLLLRGISFNPNSRQLADAHTRLEQDVILALEQQKNQAENEASIEPNKIEDKKDE
ncbi:U3 small nucleolar RNA-associated protein 6-domain-containing protein [Lipomyces arxii]|uniref:U3 small nucleolar RNA-associated protein 6-domain-containing protein n=1 Tax=Lipomyces arxii TaxID=56418 RepID=UPI0034CE51C0